MFGQIGPTEFDLRFSLLGVPVRVHPIFWLSSAFLVWRLANQDLLLVLVGVLSIFFSVLVHEMGHALVTRKYGWNSEIVLYFFGGYATSMRNSTWRDIAVSAAGPGAGFLFFFAIWIPCYLMGLVVPDEKLFSWIQVDPTVTLRWPEAIKWGTRANEVILFAIGVSFFFNLAVNILNLLPVEPLDGGQISRELFCFFRRKDGYRLHLGLGILISGGIALSAVNAHFQGQSFFGFAPGFFALMFGYLCFQNVQAYQAHKRGPW